MCCMLRCMQTFLEILHLFFYIMFKLCMLPFFASERNSTIDLVADGVKCEGFWLENKKSHQREKNKYLDFSFLF